MKSSSLLLVAMAIQVALSARAEVPEESRQYLLGVAYARAVDAALPFENTSMLSFRYTPSPLSTTSSEYAASFVPTVLDYGSSTPSTRVVLRVASEPIRLQLGQLLEANPTVSLPRLVTLVRVHRYDVFAQACPAVRAARQAFVAASASAFAIESDEHGPRTWMDAPTFHISGVADENFFELWVDSGNPLFQWAEATYKSLRSCAEAAE
jgi:hypothetical protein